MTLNPMPIVFDVLSLCAGQDPIIAAMAVEQMWLCTPAMFATGATECLKRYLMAQVRLRCGSQHASLAHAKER